MMRTQRNRYLQDRDDLRTGWFAGMGPFFAVHDAFATESQGAIQDRTQERLGYGDVAIATERQILLCAIEGLPQGVDPVGVLRDATRDWVPEVVVTTALVP